MVICLLELPVAQQWYLQCITRRLLARRAAGRQCRQLWFQTGEEERKKERKRRNEKKKKRKRRTRMSEHGMAREKKEKKTGKSYTTMHTHKTRSQLRRHTVRKPCSWSASMSAAIESGAHGSSTSAHPPPPAPVSLAPGKCAARAISHTRSSTAWPTPMPLSSDWFMVNRSTS